MPLLSHWREEFRIFFFCIGTENEPQVHSIVFSFCKQAYTLTEKEHCSDNVPYADTSASDEG